jgi:phospholipid/cholesterol/gamma-HCH transport system permease protein
MLPTEEAKPHHHLLGHSEEIKPHKKEHAFHKLVTVFGGLAVFSWRFVKSSIIPPYEIKETFRQAYQVGIRSLPLVSVVSVVIGAVLTMQSTPTMTKFGAGAYVPIMVAVSVMRELAPVLVSVIVGGRVGAGIAAELGSMRASEQIDAMEVAAIDPFRLLVVTRIVACIICLPLLTVYADTLAMIGAFVVNKIESGMSGQLFINTVTDSVTFPDYLPGILKTAFFGYIIGLVGCFMGFNSKGGTEGVGKSATDAVVTCSLLIILSDAVFVKLTILFWV